MSILRNKQRRLVQSLITGLALIVLAGCSILDRNSVPIEDIRAAEIPGMPGVRAWGGQLNQTFQADLVTSVQQEPAGVFPLNDKGFPIYHGLALSGGGSNGAFGAGILNGWSKAGTRPDFKIVTGISTGSLIAPFAFLGPEYDEQLKTVFTTTHTRDILERLSLFKILRSDAVTNSLPLIRLIEKHFDDDFLKAVARAHNQGRRLYVGTTHMDAQSLVIWNMGAIANSGHPDALELFQKIVLASSAIPGVFPPVFFDVKLNGGRYDEMHTDGGTVTQVFFHGGVIDLGAAAHTAGRTQLDSYSGVLYVIRNGKLGPEPRQIERSLGPISRRALSTMIKSAALNDLSCIYGSTQDSMLSFQYTAIPDDFESKAEEMFDPREMKRLFKLGYEMGLEGCAWQNTSPRELLKHL